MTKIYLVKGTFVKDKTRLSVTLEVFTNRKKAESYRRWKSATKEEIWTDYDSIFISIDEFTINNYDYTKEALTAELKKLPF